MVLSFFLFNNIIAGPDNIAPLASVSVSTTLDNDHSHKHLTDGIIGIVDQGEWACMGETIFWGYIRYPWIQLDWSQPYNINKVILYDRPGQEEHTAGGTLFFSDGSEVVVTGIPDNGTAKSITFPEKKVTWIRFEVTDGDGVNLGLSEIEVYPSPASYTDLVNWVDPFIETTRGRYFYFTPGSRPFGMIASAPHTRNKNQWGGGYNYNNEEILGFGQLHGWMLSGIEIMPTTGKKDPTLGQQEWKSAFSHDGEIAQPGYYRVFLKDYGIWAEQTTTKRVSFYRFRYTEDAETSILTNLGGYLGSTTMADANVHKVSDNEFEGSFNSTGRMWGGPLNIKVFFVITFDKPFDAFNGWQNGQNLKDISELVEQSTVTRRDSMTYGSITQSYWDAETAGVSANFRVKAGEEIQMKIAVSFASIENARENLEEECDHWNFDQVKSDSRKAWNDILGKIEVEGGTEKQKLKFYTDLWHVLLGRQVTNDVNGDYPDYTQGKVDWKFTDADLIVRTLPKDQDGNVKYNMYNSDGIWLTQWNLNILWGLAWPDILDDFSASLVQQADNGGLLPRGPNVGGYSYIMTSCPATNMLVSASMKNLLTKVDPEHAFRTIKRNHMPGGMFGEAEEVEFYMKNGWCPGNAGITVEWALQDWACAQMAYKLGKTDDYKYFSKRAEGWKKLLHPEYKLILPKTDDDKWLHTDLLSGVGWVEANSWQGTWSVSHDIPGLAELMGGKDTLCSLLNYTFEQGADKDFVFGYSNGYVSYANQPGCSNAHVFNYAGKPWLSQYWVRRVNEQAYGGTTPDRGYGGHDEDQGQMGGVSALMSMGLFSLRGNMAAEPVYDITSPVFDEVTIHLDPVYYTGEKFVIRTYGNSAENCYIRKAKLNGKPLKSFWFTHETFSKGGLLEIWLQDKPNKSWGSKLKYAPPSLQ
jgi:predicted alpha-1,2-mannosidase